MQYVDYYDYYYEYSAPVYFSLAASIASLALSVLLIVAMWRIFQKAGKPGWASIVPFYNIYMMYEITWGNGWRFLMLLIPFYNIVLGIQTQVKLAKAFGKSGGFAVWPLTAPSIRAFPARRARVGVCSGRATRQTAAATGRTIIRRTPISSRRTAASA